MAKLIEIIFFCFDLCSRSREHTLNTFIDYIISLFVFVTVDCHMKSGIKI